MLRTNRLGEARSRSPASNIGRCRRGKPRKKRSPMKHPSAAPRIITSKVGSPALKGYSTSAMYHSSKWVAVAPTRPPSSAKPGTRFARTPSASAGPSTGQGRRHRRRDTSRRTRALRRSARRAPRTQRPARKARSRYDFHPCKFVETPGRVVLDPLPLSRIKLSKHSARQPVLSGNAWWQRALLSLSALEIRRIYRKRMLKGSRVSLARGVRVGETSRGALLALPGWGVLRGRRHA